MALLRELLLQGPQAISAPGGGDHARAFAGQQNGGLAADPAGGAYHKYNLIFQ
jgi:hypothetical protein